MTTTELMKWYYMIYLLPGGIAMLLLLLSAAGGGARHHHHGGLRLHHGGHSHSAGHGGHHGGVKHTGAKHDIQKTAGGQVRQSFAAQMLAFFGLGRVPAPLVLGSMLLGWGLFGFWATRFMQPILHHPSLFTLPALGIAFAGALVTMRATAAVGAKLLPQEESTAISTVELCGQTGTVAFPVDETRGRVHIYDPYGTLHDVTARVTTGHPSIPKSRQILVVDYDAVRDQLVVEEIG